MKRYKTLKTISVGKSQIMVVLLAKQLSRTRFDENGSNVHNDCLKRVQQADINYIFGLLIGPLIQNANVKILKFWLYDYMALDVNI